MRFVFGYAGIPSEIYDAIYSERTKICGDSVLFVGEPLRTKTKDWNPRYTQSHCNFFLRGFANLIREDHHNRLQDTGFALLFIRHEAVTTSGFVKQFFPSTLCIEIDWALDRTSKKTIRQSKNELLKRLKEATEEAKKAIPPLKKELTERDNRTPLLLPLKNFDSKRLVDQINDLQDSLAREGDKSGVIRRAVKVLEYHHPMQTPERGFRKFFVDERKVEFRPPGSARHAFARVQSTHPETCLLAARRRLGAPYDHAFHYDCQKGSGNIRELFFGCHEERSMREGDPHLNIAPNDFVRV